MRKEFATHLKQQQGKLINFAEGMHFLWVTDFPLFEQSNDGIHLNSVHHPFTAPHPDDLNLLNSYPLKVVFVKLKNYN